MPRTKKGTTKKAKEFTYASGRRSSASARVRVYKGTGETTVNDQLVGKYFPGEIMHVAWMLPFTLSDLSGKYYFTAKVRGGGKNGQLDAVAHATAKALVKIDEKFKTALKKAGLLTRDSRTRERRKIGKGGKARRAKQSPKR